MVGRFLPAWLNRWDAIIVVIQVFTATISFSHGVWQDGILYSLIAVVYTAFCWSLKRPLDKDADGEK